MRKGTFPVLAVVEMFVWLMGPVCPQLLPVCGTHGVILRSYPHFLQVSGFAELSPFVSAKVHIYQHGSIQHSSTAPLGARPCGCDIWRYLMMEIPYSEFWQSFTHKQYPKLGNLYLLKPLTNLHWSKIHTCFSLESQHKIILFISSIWSPPASLYGHSNLG